MQSAEANFFDEPFDTAPNFVEQHTVDRLSQDRRARRPQQQVSPFDRNFGPGFKRTRRQMRIGGYLKGLLKQLVLVI